MSHNDNAMNLPLEYNKLSAYFDALTGWNPDLINRAIEKILNKHKVNTVLDLTCGTGSQVFYLTKRGYEVTGADLSPALLDIAKRKAAQEKMRISLLEGDMRSLQVGHFDAVITIANAIGHLSKAGFEQAIDNIYKNLNKDGLYIFDIFNLSSMTDAIVANLKMDNTAIVEGIKIRNIQHSLLDKRRGRLISYDYFNLQQSSGETQIFKEQFALQLYTAKELHDMLARHGFTVLGQYATDGSRFLEKKTTQMLTVAKKL